MGFRAADVGLRGSQQYIHIWGCAEKGGCGVPRYKPSVTYPLKRQPVAYPLLRSLHVFRRTRIFGYVAKLPMLHTLCTGVCNGCGPRSLLQANRFGTCPYLYSISRYSSIYYRGIILPCSLLRTSRYRVWGL